MANSFIPNRYSLDPSKICSNGPRLFGKMMGRSLRAENSLGDTPGPLGCGDYASPEVYLSPLGVRGLHLTVSPDDSLGYWDYDPLGLLNDSRLSPVFVEAAHVSLQSATRAGLRPRIEEAYRSPEESDRRNTKWSDGNGDGNRAAPGWGSCHNYGIAMDVYPHDKHGKKIMSPMKGWYKVSKALAKHITPLGFLWGEPFNDADHFEYHPYWSAAAKASFLRDVKEWAIRAAYSSAQAKIYGPVSEPSPSDWLPFVWWTAGAGGYAPSASFLADNPPPQQSDPKYKKKSKKK